MFDTTAVKYTQYKCLLCVCVCVCVCKLKRENNFNLLTWQKYLQYVGVMLLYHTSSLSSSSTPPPPSPPPLPLLHSRCTKRFVRTRHPLDCKRRLTKPRNWWQLVVCLRHLQRGRTTRMLRRRNLHLWTG